MPQTSKFYTRKRPRADCWLGWTGFVKVDDTTYTWMGAASVNGVVPPSVTQESFEFTSLRSTFIMNVAGVVSMNVSFLSPITPTDLMRQSVIGSYLSVTVASIDGGTHSVQLYADTAAGKFYTHDLQFDSDIVPEWVSATHNADVAQWR